MLFDLGPKGDKQVLVSWGNACVWTEGRQGASSGPVSSEAQVGGNPTVEEDTWLVSRIGCDTEEGFDSLIFSFADTQVSARAPSLRHWEGLWWEI